MYGRIFWQLPEPQGAQKFTQCLRAVSSGFRIGIIAQRLHLGLIPQRSGARRCPCCPSPFPCPGPVTRSLCRPVVVQPVVAAWLCSPFGIVCRYLCDIDACACTRQESLHGRSAGRNSQFRRANRVLAVKAVNAVFVHARHIFWVDTSTVRGKAVAGARLMKMFGVVLRGARCPGLDWCSGGQPAGCAARKLRHGCVCH